jgi:two-component system, NarL family, response regulator NreC
MKQWTVLLADDHALVRAGLYHLLQTFQIYHIVGEAGDGLQAIELALSLQPDVVLLDMAMPKMRGIEAIQEIKRVAPASKILVLSMHDRDEYVRQALKTGADGYLLKGSGANELKTALHDILEDRIYLSPSISKSIVSEWILSKANSESENKKTELTAREKGILKLLAEGHPNKVIASLLYISVKTVETHRSHIMQKSGTHNLAELVKYAIKIGIVDL